MRQHDPVRRGNEAFMARPAEAVRKPKQLLTPPDFTGEVLQKRRLDPVAERDAPLVKLQRIRSQPVKIVRQYSIRKTAKNPFGRRRGFRRDQRNRPADIHDPERGEHTEKHADNDLAIELVVFGREKDAARPDIAAAGGEPADRAASREGGAAAEDQVPDNEELEAEPDADRSEQEDGEEGRPGAGHLGRQAVPHHDRGL